MDLTIFEIHLEDARFGGDVRPEAPAAEELADTGESDIETDEGDSGIPRILALVPVFVVLGVAAGFVVARRLRDRGARMEDAETVEIEA